MSNFEKFLDDTISRQRIAAANREALRISYSEAQNRVNERLVAQELENQDRLSAQQAKIRERVLPIILEDVAIGYKKLAELGRTPNTPVCVDTKYKRLRRTGSLPLRIFSPFEEPYPVGVYEKFWVLGGNALGKTYRNSGGGWSKDFYQEPSSIEIILGNCLLLNSSGDIKNVYGDTHNCEDRPENFINYRDNRVTQASPSDILPNIVLDPNADPNLIHNPTESKPVMQIRDRLVHLITYPAQ